MKIILAYCKRNPNIDLSYLKAPFDPVYIKPNQQLALELGIFASLTMPSPPGGGVLPYETVGDVRRKIWITLVAKYSDDLTWCRTNRPKLLSVWKFERPKYLPHTIKLSSSSKALSFIERTLLSWHIFEMAWQNLLYFLVVGVVQPFGCRETNIFGCCRVYIMFCSGNFTYIKLCFSWVQALSRMWTDSLGQETSFE